MEKNNLANELLRFQNDFLFFQKTVSSLRKEYLNKFVVIEDKKIIDSASSIEELKDRLEKKNIDINKLVVEFISEEENIMVL